MFYKNNDKRQCIFIFHRNDNIIVITIYKDIHIIFELVNKICIHSDNTFQSANLVSALL
jgi:hypothetical protein